MGRASDQEVDNLNSHFDVLRFLSLLPLYHGLARHLMALITTLTTAYHLKYSVPDCGILKIFHV